MTAKGWQENNLTPWAPCTVNARKYSPDASKIHMEFCIIRSFIHSVNVYWAHNTLCLALLSQAMQLALLFACWGLAPQFVFCSSFLQLFRSSCFHLQGYLQISSWPAPLHSGLSSKITSSGGPSVATLPEAVSFSHHCSTFMYST